MILKFELVKVNKFIAFFRVLNVFLFLLFIILTANSVFNANLIWGICGGISIIAFIIQIYLIEMYNAVGMIIFREDGLDILFAKDNSKSFSITEKFKILLEYKGLEGDYSYNLNPYSLLIPKSGVGNIEITKNGEIFKYHFRAKDGCLTKLVKITNEYRKAGVIVDIRSY